MHVCPYLCLSLYLDLNHFVCLCLIFSLCFNLSFSFYLCLNVCLVLSVCFWILLTLFQCLFLCLKFDVLVAVSLCHLWIRLSLRLCICSSRSFCNFSVSVVTRIGVCYICLSKPFLSLYFYSYGQIRWTFCFLFCFLTQRVWQMKNLFSADLQTGHLLFLASIL